MFTDHPRSGLVYNLDGVCMYVCNTITFESLDAVSSFSHIRYISKEHGLSSYMKVIKVNVTGAKMSDSAYSPNAKLSPAITPVL